MIDRSRSESEPRPPVEIHISAGQAFKIGFYGAFGVLAAGLVPWIVGGLILSSILASRGHG